MGQLLAHNGQGHADSQQYTVCEGRSDGQAIDKVVQTVAKDHHVGYWRHPLVTMTMMMTTTVMTVSVHLSVAAVVG